VELVLDLASLKSVTCYPARINQVLLNLLTNALDACPAGGTVTVRSRPAPGGVEIHVLDTGSGIDPSIRDKIFDPFFTTKPVGRGTGLGLSISYGIIQEHGGRIDVDSTPGRGAHFIVHLPQDFPARGGSAGSSGAGR
jgi:signal transduction histidine kinase